MINKENYFQKLKFIKVGSFPSNLKNGYYFTQEATQEHTSWEFYEADSQVKAKVDKYFALLNEHLNITPKEKITEEQAKEYAKSFIRDYVLRGDSFESLASGQMGTSGGELSARIKSKKIEIDEIKKQKVDFSFSLQKIYDEVKKEKQDNGTNAPKKKAKAKTPTKPQAQKPQSKPQASQDSPKPPSINYESSKPVERIDDEIKFIKRYLSLHGRTKTKVQILNFINALKRTILEKRIRKTSKYATEIMQIQKQLVTAHAVMKDGQLFRLSAQAVEKLSEIVGSVRVRFSTQYLKRFIGIQGKNITKEKAKNLYELILKAVGADKINTADPYFDKIRNVINSLKKFVSVARNNDTLALHQETLNGLNGALGCDCEAEKEEELSGIGTVVPPHKKEEGVMSVEEARSKEYQTVNISGKYLQLIGKFCLPTQFFVYGLGGSGKSSFVLLFTQYLASLGFKILYVAGEQFNTPTFTELLNRLNIYAGDNYMIVGKIDTLNPADFDFVVLDSKDKLEVDINQFTQYMKDYPQQSFIVLSQATKNGSFTGKERWRNTVDVMIEAENGVIRTGHDKNRWGGAGEMRIFDHPSQYLKAG